MPFPDLDATVRGLYRAATGMAAWDDVLASLCDNLGAAAWGLRGAPALGGAGAPADAEPAWRHGSGSDGASSQAELLVHLREGVALRLQVTWPAGEPCDDATRVWLERLAPHLRDALQAGERLRHGPARQHLGQWLLDTLALPAWLLQADRRIVGANAAARREHAHGRWLLPGDTLLMLRDPAEQPAFDRAQAQALAAPAGRPVLAPGPSVAAKPLSRPAAARTRWRLRRLEARWPDEAAPTLVSGPPTLLAVLFDPEGALFNSGGPALDAPMLRTFFGFTPAESRVAVCLAQGCTVREMAALLAVAPTTVRSQLDQVMAKLGVTRKLDAVRLLVQGGWLWRAGHGEGAVHA